MIASANGGRNRANERKSKVENGKRKMIIIILSILLFMGVSTGVYVKLVISVAVAKWIKFVSLCRSVGTLQQRIRNSQIVNFIDNQYFQLRMSCRWGGERAAKKIKPGNLIRKQLIFFSWRRLSVSTLFECLFWLSVPVDNSIRFFSLSQRPFSRSSSRLLSMKLNSLARRFLCAWIGKRGEYIERKWLGELKTRGGRERERESEKIW